MRVGMRVDEPREQRAAPTVNDEVGLRRPRAATSDGRDLASSTATQPWNGISPDGGTISASRIRAAHRRHLLGPFTTRYLAFEIAEQTERADAECGQDRDSHEQQIGAQFGCGGDDEIAETEVGTVELETTAPTSASEPQS